MRAVLWDTSALLAYIDANDEHHAAALRTVDGLSRMQLPGFVTNYIEAEAHALLLSKLGRGAALRWLKRPGVSILHVPPQHEAEAHVLLANYADKDWSLCDAISFVFMQAHDVRQAFAYDRHFRQWGKIRILG